MDTFFQARPESGLLSAEQMLDDVVHFSKTLDSAPAIDETDEILAKAVTSVERSVHGVRCWILDGAEGEEKRRVALKVRAALQAICNLRRAIENVPSHKLSMVSRVLDIGDHLLQCHKLIVDKEVVRASNAVSIS